MYKSRILPKEEWHKLNHTEVWGLIEAGLNDKENYILVVEKDDVIVGTWVLMLKWHAECVWTHPLERKNPLVSGRLVKGMMRMARMVDAVNLVTSAETPEVENLIMKHLKGVKLPGHSYVFPVENK